jgi:hypothetical protein
LPTDYDREKHVRIYSAEERASLSKGLMCGRSSLKQQELLADLGVPRDRSMTWTKHRASKEIEKRISRRERTRQQRPEGGVIPSNPQPPRGAPPVPEHGAVNHTGMATPGSELSGGRGTHQNAPQVN